MREHSTDRSKGPQPPTTAEEVGLGSLPLGSAQSRALARSLMATRIGPPGHDGITVQFVSSAGQDPETVCKCRKPKAGELVFCNCFCSGVER
jgi:hypothetical protein